MVGRFIIRAAKKAFVVVVIRRRRSNIPLSADNAAIEYTAEKLHTSTATRLDRLLRTYVTFTLAFPETPIGGNLYM